MGFASTAYVKAQAGAGMNGGAAGGGGGAPARAATGITSPGGWHPTVLYMIALVIAEMAAVSVLTRHLLK
jgi:hypothetical protein